MEHSRTHSRMDSRMDSRYERQTRNCDRRDSSFLGSFFRFVIFMMLVVAVLGGGLWVLGATIGLLFGLVTLAVTLAPVILTVWIIWVVLKAIIS